jgi:integrase
MRTGDNPFAWKGHLADAFVAKPPVKHLRAYPYADMSALMERLRSIVASPSIMALEFTVLCATRTSETLDARWQEIDFHSKTWVSTGGTDEEIARTQNSSE